MKNIQDIDLSQFDRFYIVSYKVESVHHGLSFDSEEKANNFIKCLRTSIDYDVEILLDEN